MTEKKGGTHETDIRSESWLKIKPLRTCDCVIFGYTKGEGGRALTFGSLVVGLYDNGKPVYVCNISSGLTQKMLGMHYQIFSKKPSKKKSETSHGLCHCLSVKLIFQSVTKDFSLRAPRIKCVRTDKKPSECTIEQIHNTK